MTSTTRITTTPNRGIQHQIIKIWEDADNLGNRFAYVAGMVVNHSDPSGLECGLNDPLYALDLGISEAHNKGAIIKLTVRNRSCRGIIWTA